LDAAAVINRIRAGSKSAFGEIVDCYQFPILRYLHRLTANYDVARDLTQDTFIQAYKNILKTDDGLNLKAWLYRIATNNALQYHRRRKIVSFIPFESFHSTEPPGNGAHPGDSTEEIAIKEALKKIPYRQRTCLVLHHVEGFRYREIAETLGISEDAVRQRVARGKETFRRLYDGGK
jgi:RNA polymerase sigma-70 factor (ECF subfamily)